MTRVDIEEFSDKDISRIFIAGSMREAESVEYLLTENAVSYALQIEEFVSLSFISGSVKKGIVFYVLSGQRDYCRLLLIANGFRSGLIDED